MRLGIVLPFVLLAACGRPDDQDNDFELAGRRVAKSESYGAGAFPTGPAPDLTPGALCKTPDEYRYPEKIPYCRRSVSTGTKNQVIRTYDSKLHFKIESMPRNDFKIDHYIPLCMGGANEASNLWPQHKSVYNVTDPLEPRFCTLMERGKITQADAIEQIKYAKNHLSEVDGIVKQLDDLLDGKSAY